MELSDAVKVAIVGELRSFGVPLSRCARIIASIPPGPMAKIKLVMTPDGASWVDTNEWLSPVLARTAVLVVRPDKLIVELMDNLKEQKP